MELFSFKALFGPSIEQLHCFGGVERFRDESQGISISFFDDFGVELKGVGLEVDEGWLLASFFDEAGVVFELDGAFLSILVEHVDLQLHYAFHLFFDLILIVPQEFGLDIANAGICFFEFLIKLLGLSALDDHVVLLEVNGVDYANVSFVALLEQTLEVPLPPPDHLLRHPGLDLLHLLCQSAVVLRPALYHVSHLLQIRCT